MPEYDSWHVAGYWNLDGAWQDIDGEGAPEPTEAELAETGEVVVGLADANGDTHYYTITDPYFDEESLADAIEDLMDRYGPEAG